ncbi:GlxA family transcriptional regulator [Enterobacter bugandensis]|uniref:GlxA family transcriptional regulator n=1 Tax=Enterobacteriaceae TaxID=543 RepID=UPI00124ADE24|nr:MULTISPECIES: GlxA family transcriptional regulator [Enterobacteriaceae]HBU6133628.1 GlxA family transcriptional regulator [Enterobacter cloacae]MBF2750892.1 GlxA family transcriptional regulator [Enterobacter bugandensis]MBF2792911.1 GlxA family transcriptional regulator [Enterobacter asburiae]MBF2803483.1 GlxA family transcriptional regulator [Enterobacter bugandensis]MCP1116249.1 GlxA family transcriptional regulator [Enterobacter bugandensis]
MRITLLAFPRVQLLDVVGPADVFAEAARQLGNPRAYSVEVIGTRKGMIKGSNGLKIGIDKTFETSKGKIDTLLVAGSPYIDEIALDPALQDWLRRQMKSVRRIGSVCSGAFILATAGLLDGRHVTTHWNCSAKLAREHPKTHVHPDSIYIKDGNLYTSAGVTAGMDLALALVEEDYGRKLALSVAREMVMFFKRPGGQAQFSAQLAAQTAERSVIREVQDYVVEHLKSDLSVPTLAARAGMSERNFARTFKTEVGMTPAEFVELARIDVARRLIEDADVSLKRLASTVGYANTDGFRRAFMRRIGVRPRDYRKRFSSV